LLRRRYERYVNSWMAAQLILTINKALGQIGELYFAIVLPRGQAANPLGDMFSALMGGPPGGGAQASQRRRLPPPAANPTTTGLD
jgi:hypothetical protein